MVPKLKSFASTIIAAACVVSAAARADEWKKLSTADLAVQTHKWDGKKLEVKIRCFYADKDEYRCAGGGARLDMMTITNDEGRSYIEDNCDTMAKVAGNGCIVTVRFTYSRFTEIDNDTGGKMTVIIPEDFAGEVIAPAARKRR